MNADPSGSLVTRNCFLKFLVDFTYTVRLETCNPSNYVKITEANAFHKELTFHEVYLMSQGIRLVTLKYFSFVEFVKYICNMLENKIFKRKINFHQTFFVLRPKCLICDSKIFTIIW